MQGTFRQSMILPRLLGAIGVTSTLAGCGGEVQPDPASGPIGGSSADGQGAAGGGSSPEQAAADACASTPWGPSRVNEFCLGREAMEAMAARGYGQVGRVPLRSEQEVQGGFDESGCLRHDWVGDDCCNPAVGPGEPRGELCCYRSCGGACCGRPLRIDGVAHVAALRNGREWLLGQVPPPQAAAAAGSAREALARAWEADAQMEHASIASFARFCLQLLALGAPAPLVEAAQAAGADEVRHARVAFTIAHRLGGRARAPSSLPQAGAAVPTRLVEVVAAVIAEGCVGETISAAVAQRQAESCKDPTIRAALEQIAEDEARHAELAWRFVAWALVGSDEALIAQAQRAFEATIEAGLQCTGDGGLSEGVLHAHGRLSVAEQRRVHEQTVHQALIPAFQALVGECRRRAGRPARRSDASA